VTATWVGVLAGYLHLLAVATYVGGSIAMEVVLGPAQKFIPPAQAQVVAQRSADRFLILVWSSLALFPISGLLLFFSQSDQSVGLFSTGFGRTLFTMMMLWVLLVINGAVITFVLRPRLANRAKSKGGAAAVAQRLETMQRAATQISWVTRVDLLVALFIVLLGASMAYGNGLL
jgi:uncharacterized membrane protein